MDQVFADLLEKRKEINLDKPPAGDFYVKVDGGVWTAAHCKCAFNAYRAEPRKSPPEDFCIALGLNRSASFAIKEYSDEGALRLASAWVDMHQRYFDCCTGGRAAGSQGFVRRS